MPEPATSASALTFDSAASRDRFEALVAEADAVSVDGWDFSWLDGRATEERPSWGYARAMADRLGRARAALDLQTGGGEVLASAPKLPPVTVATEAWPPNIARATALLHPLGAVVVADEDEPPLPFGDAAFDLGGVRRIMTGVTTPGTAPRGVAETPESLRDEDVPAPCDAPHQTPRPVRP